MVEQRSKKSQDHVKEAQMRASALGDVTLSERERQQLGRSVVLPEELTGQKQTYMCTRKADM